MLPEEGMRVPTMRRRDFSFFFLRGILLLKNRIMKNAALIFSALLVVGVAFGIGVYEFSKTETRTPVTSDMTVENNLVKLRVGESEILVELAISQEEKAKGLSERDTLGQDRGMLFLFDAPAQLSFWMKDMRFSLDFIWIRDGVVVDLTTDVPVPEGSSPLRTYQPSVTADAVLEVNAGWAVLNGIGIGDEVVIEQ